MRGDCIRLVTEAAAKVGKTLSQADFRNIEVRVRDARKQNKLDDPDRYNNLTDGEQVREAGERAAREIVAEKARKAKGIAETIRLRAEADAYVDARVMGVKDKDGKYVGGGMSATEAVNRLMGNNQDARTGKKTMEQLSDGVANFFNGKMRRIEEFTAKYAGFWSDKKSMDDLQSELHDKPTRNVLAAEMAKLWKEDIAEPIRRQKNELGADVGRLRKGGYDPQVWDSHKVAATNLYEFLSDMRQWTDRSQYLNNAIEPMKDTEFNALFGPIHQTLATDGAIKPALERGGGGIKNRGSEHRVIHFKDADSAKAAYEKYGRSHIVDRMVAHVSQSSKQIAALKMFGPNAEAVVKSLYDAAERRDAAAGHNVAVTKANRYVGEATFKLAAGLMGSSGNPEVSAKWQIARTVQAIMKMGSTPVKALTDAKNIIATAKAWGLPSPVAQWLKTGAQVWSDRELRRFLRYQGSGTQTLAHNLSRVTDDIMGHGRSAVVANSFFKAIGLNALDTGRRNANDNMLMHHIGDLAKAHESVAHVEKVDKMSAQQLRASGVTDKAWAVWRAAMGQKDLPFNMLSPDAIMKIPDAALAHIGTSAKPAVPYIKAVEAKPQRTEVDPDTGRITVRDRVLAQPGQKAQPAQPFKADKPDQLRRDAAQELAGVTARYTNTVVPLLGLRQRGMVESMLHSLGGSHFGELAKSSLWFKSFPLADFANHWQRAMSMPTTKSKISYLATVYASSLVLGGVVQQIYTMISGHNPENIKDPKFAARALIVGGGIPLYAEMLINAWATPYRESIADQLGPLFSDLEKVVKIAQDKTAKEGETRSEMGGDVVRLLRGDSGNIWYLKAALDHLLFQRVADHYSPGYAQRVQKKYEKDYGAGGFWWPPSSAATMTKPQAPNLKTAIGRQ
jgi:hypothetical protein